MKCRPRKSLMQPRTRGGVGVLMQDVGNGLCVRSVGVMRGPGSPVPSIPIFTGTIPNLTALIDRVSTYDVSGNFQHVITYTLQNAPAGVTIGETTGIISWSPTVASGPFAGVTVTGTNEEGEVVSNEFSMESVAYYSDSFVIIVRTTGVDELFTFWSSETAGDIDWGDGTIEPFTADMSHTYAVASDYTIHRTEVNRLGFGLAVEAPKIREIANWGPSLRPGNRAVAGGLGSAFRDAINLVVTATDKLALSGNDSRIFQGCAALTGLPGGIDTSLCSGLRSSFQDTLYNSADASSWVLDQTVGTVSLRDTLRNTPFNQDISNWQITDISSMTGFMLGSQLSTVNYDAALIAFDAQDLTVLVNGDAEVHFGSSTYSAGAAATARQNIVNRGILVTDGGPA